MGDRVSMNILKENNRGSVLVIVVVITSVLFGIGVAFSSILEKEIIRQLYGERSQTALNIANSALECTLYNDFRRHVFNEVLFGQGVKFDCGPLFQVRRINQGVEEWSEVYRPKEHQISGTVTGENTHTYVIIASDQADLSGVSFVPCAQVTVKKECTNDTGDDTICDGLIVSSVEVKGYHVCSSGDASSRELVRRFKIRY